MATTTIHRQHQEEEKRWCKTCFDNIQVVQHVKRRGLNEGYDGSDVYWDYKVGACGHVVEDHSY